MIAQSRMAIVQWEFSAMNGAARVFLKDFYEILRSYDI